MSEKTIFMGSEAFDKLTKRIGVVCKSRATIYQDVRYELADMLEPNQCITMDQDIIDMLKKLGI